jgi:hypothetical protein
MAAAAEFEVTARRTYETGFIIVCSVASIAHTVGVGIRLIETVTTISRHESRRNDRGVNVHGGKLPKGLNPLPITSL